jgi:hypothetical protein
MSKVRKGTLAIIVRVQPELTGWFPPGVNPVRDGVYLATVVKSEEYYRRWANGMWCVGGDTPALAAAAPRIQTRARIYWRGLATPSVKSRERA